MATPRSSGLTRHAYKRVLQRLLLSGGQLVELLDRELAVSIGRRPGTSHLHRLFFSPPNGECFVAIQDELTGDVITILPLDFHAVLAWPVAPQDEEQARALMRGVELGPSQSRGVPHVFRLTVHYISPSGAPKATNLGSWPCAPYAARVEQLVADDAFVAAVWDRIREKSVPVDRVRAVFVRAGRRSPPVRVRLDGGE